MTELDGELLTSEIVAEISHESGAWAFAVENMEGRLEESTGDHYAPDQTSQEIISAVFDLYREGEMSLEDYMSKLALWRPVLDTLKVAYQTPHMWPAVQRGEVFDGSKNDIYVSPSRAERAAELMVMSGLIQHAEAA